jgi:hypothetical protein
MANFGRTATKDSQTAPAAPQSNVPAPAPAAPVETPAPAAKQEKATVDLGFINGAVMLDPTLAEASAPVRARSEKQMAMDTQVEKLHGVWVAAGKPSTWEKMVAGKTVATYFSEPELSSDLKKLIDRAVSFKGVRARYGTSFTATPELVKRFSLPDTYVGREVISFAVMDKRARTTSGGKTAAEIVEK